MCQFRSARSTYITDHLTQRRRTFAFRVLSRRDYTRYIKFRIEKESSADSPVPVSFESAGFTLTPDDRLCVRGNGRGPSLT